MLDKAHNALAHEKRRELVQNVRQADQGYEIEELTAPLYHTHLPILDRNGFVDWDEQTDTVYEGEHFDTLVELL